MTVNFNETQTVGAPIAPTGPADVYATHFDEFGSGGYRSITTGTVNSTATDAEINAQIPGARRKVGMLVFDTTTGTYHRCTNADSGVYSVEDFGANAGSVTSVDLSMPAGFDVDGGPVTSTGILAVTTTLGPGLVKTDGSGFSVASPGSDYALGTHSHSPGDVDFANGTRLLGRYSTNAGDGQEISLGTGLSLNVNSGVLTSFGLGGTVQEVLGSNPITVTDTSSPQGSQTTYTVTHNTSGVTAKSYGSASSVPTFTVDDKGHLIAAQDVSITGFLPTSGGTVSGPVTVSNDLTVSGNLNVTGQTTTINSTTLNIVDKNIELAANATDDVSADGGGITLKGATEKTFNWIDATDSWTSSEHLDLASAHNYRIAGNVVLSATGLGSGVTSSSLTSVGTLTGGTWQANDIGLAYGGTGADLSGAADGTIFKKQGAALVAATVGSDYLSDASVVDGGTY